MSLFKKGSPHIHQDVQLVFDIGSASVGGAIVVLTKEKKPRILYATRKQIIFQENLNFERFVSSLFETFESVIRLMERKGIKYLNEKQIKIDTIEKVLFMYASPWYMARTKILKLTKKKPITITQNLINKLIKQEGVNKNQEKQTLNNQGNIIEQTITAIKLNGYHIASFEGKKAKKIELTISTTTLSRNVARGLEQELEKIFHCEEKHHQSFPLTSFTAVRDIFHEEKNFLLLDVSGEVSDLSLIKDGALLETASFPKGVHFVVRQLMKRLNLSYSEAQSRLQMYSTKKITEKIFIETDAVINLILTDWSSDFRNTLSQIEKDLSLPSKIFYTADRYFLPILETFIHQADEENLLEAHSIGYMELKKDVDFTGDKTHDIFIGIGAFLLNKEFQM